MVEEVKEVVEQKVEVEQVYQFLKSVKKFIKYFSIAGAGLLSTDQVTEIGNTIDLIIGSGIIGAVAMVLNILKYKFNLKWIL